MKNLRSHILKTCIVALVCSGLMIGFSEPANATHSNEDFANWLQSLTKKVDTPELEQKLQSLKQSNVDLEQLIEKASQIVSQNNEDFNIPVENTSNNIQHILLVEWNQYQTGNAMTAVPAPETLKPTVAPKHHKLVFPNISPAVNDCKKVQSWTAAIAAVVPPNVSKTFNTAPMMSGIAIGAP